MPKSYITELQNQLEEHNLWNKSFRVFLKQSDIECFILFTHDDSMFAGLFIRALPNVFAGRDFKQENANKAKETASVSWETCSKTVHGSAD